MRIKLRFFPVNLFCARDKLPRVAVLRPWDLIFYVLCHGDGIAPTISWHEILFPKALVPN